MAEDEAASDAVKSELVGSENLLAWARFYLPHYVRVEYSKLHRWLAEELDAQRQRRGARLNVIGPRGSAKSTLVTLAHVLRAAVEAWEPYIWIVSDTRPQARLHLDNLKAELVENDLLAERYPKGAGRGPRWQAEGILLSNGVAVEAISTGQRVRGRRHRAHRPTLIVCDDLENDRHALSARLREQSRRWFHGALVQAGTRETNIVHLATALHREALALMLTRTPGWTSRTFPAILRWPDNMVLWQEWEAIYSRFDQTDCQRAAREFYERNRPLLDAGADLLWPEGEDLYTLMCLRAEGGPAAFEREKQGVPVSPEMCEWPEDWFGPDLWFDQWPPEPTTRALALDPSKGRDDRHGDYSAFVLLAFDKLGVGWVEADLARRPTTQMVADGVELVRRFDPELFGIESNQYQELLGAEFVEELQRQGLMTVEPVPLENLVNKRTRIRRLTRLLAKRRLRFKADSPSTRLLVEQLRDFPIAEHDDGPDALEMALRLVEGLLDVAPFDDGLGNRLVR